MYAYAENRIEILPKIGLKKHDCSSSLRIWKFYIEAWQATLFFEKEKRIDCSIKVNQLIFQGSFSASEST